MICSKNHPVKLVKFNTFSYFYCEKCKCEDRNSLYILENYLNDFFIKEDFFIKVISLNKIHALYKHNYKEINDILILNKINSRVKQFLKEKVF